MRRWGSEVVGGWRSERWGVRSEEMGSEEVEEWGVRR